MLYTSCTIVKVTWSSLLNKQYIHGYLEFVFKYRCWFTDILQLLATASILLVNGLHLYSPFIQSTVQLMPLIHPFTHAFTHAFTHQRRLAAMKGTNQLFRSNWGLGVVLRDTSTRPGWDRTGNPPTARQQLLPPEPYRPYWMWIFLYRW